MNYNDWKKEKNILEKNIYDFKSYLELYEGGNTRAINRETGEAFAFAKKLQLDVFKRKLVTTEFKHFFKILNDLYDKKFGIPLWKKFDIIQSGFAFNGSSDAFFNNAIPDEEFVMFKKSVGDIDVTIPHNRLSNLFDLLASLEGKQLTPTIKYLGQNKKTFGGHQINALFLYKEGEFENAMQIDFEGVDYDVDEFSPTEWAKFGHSSDWADIKQGFKGVNHKFLLINLARGISKREDIMLATPAAVITREKPPRLVKMKPGDVPRMLAFSVDKGLRVKIEQQFYDDGEPVIIDGKFIFKEMPSKDATNYVTSKEEIFKVLFNRDPQGDDLVKLDSFVGVIELIKKYSTTEVASDTLDFLVFNNLFGPAAQGLERNNPQLDFEIKWAMVKYFFKEFHFLQKNEKNILAMAEKYAENYKMMPIVD